MRIRQDRIPPSLSSDAVALEECLRAFDRVLPVVRVLLFGSHARGDAGSASDVDLCIVANGVVSQRQAGAAFRRAIGLLRRKPPLTLIPISPERLEEKRRAHDPFFETVLNEGIVIAEED